MLRGVFVSESCEKMTSVSHCLGHGHELGELVEGELPVGVAHNFSEDVAKPVVVEAVTRRAVLQGLTLVQVLAHRERFL